MDMKILGITVSPNVLAVILGMVMILFCLAIAYIFQKHLFGRCRRTVPTRAEDDLE